MAPSSNAAAASEDLTARDLAERFEEALDAGMGSSRPQQREHRGRGGGGKRGGRAGKDGGGGNRRNVDLSKALSRLLRHQAENAGVQLDKEGYASLDKVLQWGPLRSLAPTFDEINSIVHNSDKQRFALKPNPATNPSLSEDSTDPSHWLIRANQGHSIKLESEHLLRPLAPAPSPGGGPLPDGAVPVPPVVVHGTYFAFWPAIVASGGLKPMSRTHVHFGTGLPEDQASGVISGMRHDAELVVYVDVERAMREAPEMKWWMSDNGVVLTEGDAEGLVPTRFFKEVVGRAQGVGLLWKDGDWVADLPDGLTIRTPLGKRAGGGRGGGGRGRGGRGRGRGR
ncbi:hypothetical protein VTJ83DRAFT_1090 [Remersonia thermophila]|uniref:2'-phosphotransferase n=1 Tax=Remersonia thermophila TaxID=72144 RepID=A0ABR4DN29_9PEZI